MSQQVLVKQDNGITYTCDSLEEAIDALREVYGEAIGERVVLGVSRVFVWRDAHDAANDEDGSRACATISQLIK